MLYCSAGTDTRLSWSFCLPASPLPQPSLASSLTRPVRCKRASVPAPFSLHSIGLDVTKLIQRNPVCKRNLPLNMLMDADARMPMRRDRPELLRHSPATGCTAQRQISARRTSAKSIAAH